MNRKFAVILLLFIFVTPVVTTFTFLQIQKYRIRKEVRHRMIAGMEKEELVLFRFTRDDMSDLEWEHSGEFTYCGRMYDVVDSETKGDTTWYWCWEDNEETALNRQLSELVAGVLGNSPVKKESRNNLIAFYYKLYNQNNNLTDLPGTARMLSDSPVCSENYSGIHPSPPVPPPRVS